MWLDGSRPIGPVAWHAELSAMAPVFHPVPREASAATLGGASRAPGLGRNVMGSTKGRPWRVSRCSTDRGHLDAPRARGTSPQGEGEQGSAEGTARAPALSRAAPTRWGLGTHSPAQQVGAGASREERPSLWDPERSESATRGSLAHEPCGGPRGGAPLGRRSRSAPPTVAPPPPDSPAPWARAPLPVPTPPVPGLGSRALPAGPPDPRSLGPAG